MRRRNCSPLTSCSVTEHLRLSEQLGDMTCRIEVQRAHHNSAYAVVTFKQRRTLIVSSRIFSTAVVLEGSVPAVKHLLESTPCNLLDHRSVAGLSACARVRCRTQVIRGHSSPLDSLPPQSPACSVMLIQKSCSVAQPESEQV